MAIRQYVGARYVPRFTGLYDATQIYDALDVVDNGSGTSYIAKKTVPAGTPLTDTDYWFIYGASSGAILSLQNRMTAAESDIVDLTARADRRFVLIADSYGEGTGATPADGWTAQFKSTLNLDNDHCYINQLGGSGFVGNVATRFVDLLEGIAGTVTNPDTITDVVVCGGFNDFGKAAVNSAVFNFCVRANQLFPNAIISIGMIGYSTQSSNAQRNGIRKTLEDYYIGRGSKTRVLPGLEYCLRKTAGLMGSDGIHPTALGYLAISKCIISAVLGGDGYDYFGQLQTVTFTDVTNHASTCAQIIDRDKALLYLPNGLSFVTLGVTKPHFNGWLELGTFGSGNILHGTGSQLSDLQYRCAKGWALMYSPDFPGTHYADTNCLLGIYEDKLYLQMRGVNPATGSFYDCSNVDTISLGGVWEFDTLDM